MLKTQGLLNNPRKNPRPSEKTQEPKIALQNPRSWEKTQGVAMLHLIEVLCCIILRDLRLDINAEYVSTSNSKNYLQPILSLPLCYMLWFVSLPNKRRYIYNTLQ